MIGIALGIFLWWCARPWRPAWRDLRAHPSTLVLPAVLAAAALHEVNETAGLLAFAVLVPAVALLGMMERDGAARRVHLPVAARVAGMLAWALVAWLSLRDVVGGGSLSRAFVPVVATALVLTTVLRARRGGGLDVGPAVWAATGYLAVSLVFGGLTGQEWVACSEVFDKCTPVGQLYRGPFPSENTLAFMAAIVAMVALQLSRSARRNALLLGLVTVVFLTGSRTSAMAVVAALVGAWLLQVTAIRRGPRSYRLHPIACWVAATAPTALGLWLVYTAAPGSFSLRGTVWAQARSVVSGSSLWGEGHTRYQDLLELGWFRGHYPHSQYLLLQFFGGLAAVMLFALVVGCLLVAVRTGSRRAAGAAAAPVLFTLAFGLTEVAWNPLGMAPDLWPMVLLFAAVPFAIGTDIDADSARASDASSEARP